VETKQEVTQKSPIETATAKCFFELKRRNLLVITE
jgi:hypothetical protein